MLRILYKPLRKGKKLKNCALSPLTRLRGRVREGASCQIQQTLASPAPLTKHLRVLTLPQGERFL